MNRIAFSRFHSVARFAGIGAIVFGALLFSSHSGFTRAAEKELSPKDRAAILEDVWRNVRDRYYDPEFHGINWDEVGNRYRPLVQNVKSDPEFYALVSRMTGELHDGHTRFYSADQWDYHEKDLGVSIGFFTAEREGAVVVTDVSPDSEAAHAGIEPGMIVLTVNGKPIADLIAQAEKTVLPSSTERLTRRRVLSSPYTGGIGAAFQIGLQRADGTKFEVSITKQIIPTPPDVRAILLPSGEAYIRFDGFKPPVVQEFYEAIEKYRNAPGVIIDLRYNGGGQTNVLSAI